MTKQGAAVYKPPTGRRAISNRPSLSARNAEKHMSSIPAGADPGVGKLTPEWRAAVGFSGDAAKA
jgi:hypothetical protein